MRQRGTGTMRGGAPRRRTGFWVRFLTMAAIVLAVVCCITLFFQVREIHVTGSHLYTEEQVAAASGISIGDNLISIKKANAASLIMTSLPFVEQVHITRTLPGTVEITVQETDVTFSLRAQNETYYLISAEGKLLSELPTANAGDYPQLNGLTVAEPVLGETVSVPDEEADSWNAALRLMQLLSDYGIAGGVKEINVSKPYDLRVAYGTQFDIMLGGSDNLDYKVEYLAAVLKELGDSKAGTIDLTFEEEKTARFQPY